MMWLQFLRHQRVRLCCRLTLLSLGCCLCLLLLPAQARALTYGYIKDDAHVLNAKAVQQSAEPLSYDVDIYTTKSFRSSTADFDASVQKLAKSDTHYGSCDPAQQVGCEPGTFGGSTYYSVETSNYSGNSVEIGIDVSQRHIAIYGGKNVSIDQKHYIKAITAFRNTMHQTHDNYTQATMAVLNTLETTADRVDKWLISRWPGFLMLFVFIVIWIVVSERGWLKSSSESSSDDWRGTDPWSGGGGYGGYGGYGGGGGFGGGGGGGGGASGNF